MTISTIRSCRKTTTRSPPSSIVLTSTAFTTVRILLSPSLLLPTPAQEKQLDTARATAEQAWKDLHASREPSFREWLAWYEQHAGRGQVIRYLLEEKRHGVVVVAAGAAWRLAACGGAKAEPKWGSVVGHGQGCTAARPSSCTARSEARRQRRQSDARQHHYGDSDGRLLRQGEYRSARPRRDVGATRALDRPERTAARPWL